MVLEALAAVGLAGNICQFIDFSFQLFHTVTSIHRSGAGAPVDIQRLQEITQALQQWCQRLASSRLQHSQHNTPNTQVNLYRLGENCETAAEELLSVTNALKAKDPKSKWTTFKIALAAVWSESKTKEMEARLTSYRLQLILELELMQSDGQDSIISLLDHLSKLNQRMEASLDDQISNLRNDISLALATIRADLRGSSQQPAAEDATNVNHAALNRCQTAGYDIAQSLRILDEIRFEQMHTRHTNITLAYEKTYEWIFLDKFQEWARSPEPAFWVSGKPGSGKSTLMKFPVDHERTPGLFLDWCGEHKLIIATYFFWINGSALQRSQEGLLRALLYDILRQCPDQIRTVLPERWRAASGFYNDRKSSDYSSWTLEELVAAFRRLCAFGETDKKFCVFIDGLDEYQGDCEELVETILSLPRLGVKLCVASRPWNIFEESFGSNPNQKMYMQELNKPDIRQFVDGRLRTHRNFSSLTAPEADEIISELTEKSQGVFLWVYLVVRSLLEGLRNRDSITFLRKRLRAFPSDLDDFFRHIFDSLDPTYRSNLSHMFQVALTALEPIHSIAYWYLDEIEESPDMALSVPLQVRSAQDMLSTITEVAVRVNGRSKGLMEVVWIERDGTEDNYTPEMMVHEYSDYNIPTVDFLHRTVKDFLKIPETEALLQKWQQPKFEPDLILCKMLLAEIKYIGLSDPPHRTYTLKSAFEAFFHSAQRCEQTASRILSIHLDDFAKTQDSILKSGVISNQQLLTYWQEHEVIGLAAASNLKSYVDTTLNTSLRTDDQILHLIAFVLSDMAWKFAYVNSDRSPSESVEALFEMVAFLRGKLSDPQNHIEFLRIVKKLSDSSIYKEKDLGFRRLLELSVINKEEFEELLAMRFSQSRSSPPTVTIPQTAAQKPNIAQERLLESISTAFESSAGKKNEHPSETAVQQRSSGYASTDQSPTTSPQAPKRKSIRVKVKNLISRLH